MFSLSRPLVVLSALAVGIVATVAAPTIASAATTTTGTTCAAAEANQLVEGGSLTAGKSLVSANGTYKLTLATDGSLTLANASTGGRRWVQQGGTGAHLDLRAGGKLVLVAKDGTTKWANSVAATCPVVFVHDSGYVVSSHGTVVDWNAPTSSTPLTVPSTAVTAPVPTTPTPTTPPTTPAPTTPARDVSQLPFSSTSPWNTSIGSGAKFEAATGPITSKLAMTTPTLNSSRWSIAVFYATTSDPIATVTNPNTGASIQVRVPRNTAPTYGTDKHVGVIQPDGVTGYEFYKMTNVGTDKWTSTRIVKTDLRTDGMTDGARASGVSFYAGLIRTQELKKLSIKHTLALGISDAQLKSGAVWPARTQDANGATAYTGTIPMGTLFAIPSSVNIDAMNLTAEGKALGHALQNYGAHVLVRSSTQSLFCEHTCDATQAANANKDWKALSPLLRAVTNNTATNVAGGGTRLVAALPTAG
ncbi:hypothetical protein [Cellulomonas sp. P5_C6]